MKEIEYLKTIKKALSDSSYIGDDCAFLQAEDIGSKGIHITQDSLVEDVHFSLETISPYQLGKKAINVNLSDLAAVCAVPLFVTISLSMPKDLDKNFVEEFYKGVNEVCEQYKVKVVGGDITGSEKVFVSICAIGKKVCDFDISRKYAKVGDVVVTTGFHGDSAGGFRLFNEQDDLLSRRFPVKQVRTSIFNVLTQAHLYPQAQLKKSVILAKTIKSGFAMMDTSDGLADALYKIASDSDVSIEVDFASIPISENLKLAFPDEYQNLVLWGGEDYQLLFCISASDYQKLNKKEFFKIGTVSERSKNPVTIVDGENSFIIDKETFESKSFNHFGEKEQ